MTDTQLRPEIASSWKRSGLCGLRADAPPRLQFASVDLSRPLLRVAAPVLTGMVDELAGSSTGVVLADQAATIVDVRCTERSIGSAMSQIGANVGARFGEETTGTNSLGTPVEIRRGLAVSGSEHFYESFKGFSCYGHPIVHPLTRRLEGVLDISSREGDEHPLFAALVRRVVREIEEALALQSPRSHQRLMAAFDARARSFGPGSPPAVVAVGADVVVATQAALDQLSPHDHVMLHAVADEMRPGSVLEQRVTLASGCSVVLRGRVPSGATGAIFELLEHKGKRRAVSTHSDRPRGWPLLVVGESGTGRTTQARAALGPCVEVDAADAARVGEAAWWSRVDGLSSGSCGPNPTGLLVENVHLLSERLAILLAGVASDSRRGVVLTTTPEGAENSPVTTFCVERLDLTPLRLRRHDIPAIAQAFMSETSRARLTPATLRAIAAQPWPGNLRELRRVIEGLASVRSCGDIVPSDLPTSHRSKAGPELPRERAEAEVIAAAIRAADGNKARAAQNLGVSRSTLYNRIHALKIDV